MTVVLRIDIDEALAQSYFDYAGYYARDAREPLRDVQQQVVFPAVRGQLDSEGERSGGRWEELSDDYLLWKEAHFPGEPMLRLEHHMERSLFDPLSFTVTQHSLTYHPNDDKVAWHQEGAMRSKGGRLPQRTIVDLTVEDNEQIETIFTNWLYELANANRARDASQPFEFNAPNIFTLGI